MDGHRAVRTAWVCALACGSILSTPSLLTASPPFPATSADSAATAADSLAPAYTLPGIVVLAPHPDGPPADRISEDQIHRTAATADDAFRVVQGLPGIAAPDYSASFLVRGGESDETLVRLDGIDLLEPYHIPYWGGAISVVSPDAVHAMRLSRGGLPARYGRQLSGALEIESPDERPPRPQYRLGAGPTQLRALVSGPMRGGGSYLFGARHGLLAALGRLHPIERNAEVEPDFQDLIGEVKLHPSQDDAVTFLALGAREKLRYDMPYDESDLNGTVRNMTLGATWTHHPSSSSQERAVLSADRFERLRTLGRGGRDYNVTRAIRGRLEGQVPLGGGESFEWGMAAEYEDAWVVLDGIQGSIVESGYQEQAESSVSGTATRRRVEAFASVKAPAGSNASVTLGVNASRDFYAWGLHKDGVALPGTPGFAFLSPRLSFSGRVGGAATVWGSMGLMRQPAFLNHVDEDRTSLPLGRNREAAEAIVGLESRPAGMTLRAESYLRSERGVGLPLEDADTHPMPPYPLDRGTSRGLELIARSPQWERADATVSYAWSRAAWTTPQGNVPRPFDQLHAATLSLNVRPAGRWNLNATARVHSGTPYTPSLWSRADSGGAWTREFGSFMGARYPTYFRLDLRLSHALPFGVSGGTGYIELVNATAHQNVHMYTYQLIHDPNGEGLIPRREAVELFPRMPAAGFEVSF